MGYTLKSEGLADDRWRGHFFAAAAEAMRRILISCARRRHAQKRGGGFRSLSLDGHPAGASPASGPFRRSMAHGTGGQIVAPQGAAPGVMNDDRQSLRTIFNDALEIADPVQRAGYLDRACGEDLALRRSIEELIQAGHDAGGFLHGDGSAQATTRLIEEAKLTENPGTVIGRYKLLERLGEGGFGAVWAAEQREPVKRRVALKIIKLGMDTKQVVARFEAERQALALMDHPNIAKVLDAGTTENGRPFFVMELVRGIPITQYGDQEKLPVRDRLDLFIRVCHAIQHAHQKGIIHRDIKPSNILVTLHDGVPVPKVIDFGIAKATQGELTDKTIYTQFQQFIGTPAYMSPEQAEMGGLDIDTRSDIYSLGVLLYELLTGSTPFDTKELMQSGLDEMRRIIREREPVRPSTRLTQTRNLTETQSKIENRKSKIEKDLDWIVMKCLEKDRARRYDTANGLAADLKRHLNDEPVTARPPSTAYRLHKAYRKHKLAFGAAATVVLALALGFGFAMAGWRQARVEGHRALGFLEETEEARKAEATARSVAEHEGAKAQRVADELLENLYSADMGLAYQALQANDFASAVDLINKYRPHIPVGDYAASADRTAPMARPRDLLGWEWRWLWQLCRSDELQTLQASSNAVRCAVLAPQGRLLATASDRSLQIMDYTSMEIVATVGGHQEFDDLIDTRAVAFSSDGRYLAAKGGTAIRVWKVGQWEAPYKRLEGVDNFNFNSAVVFSPDSRTLGTRVKGGISFWDTETWEMTLLPAPERLGTMMKYSRDGALLALDFLNYANNSGDLQIRDAKTLALITHLVRRPPPTHGGVRVRVQAVDFSDQFLAVGHRDGELKLYDLATWVEVASVPAHRSHILGLAFSPDGRTLATGGTDQVILLWDVASLAGRTGSRQAAQPVKQLRGHRGSLYALTFFPDGQKLLSASLDGTVKTWSAAWGDDASGLRDVFQTVWFSPDARQVITSSNAWGTDLVLWDTVTRENLGRVVPAEQGANYRTGAVSEDGRRVAMAAGNGVIDVWHLQTNQRVRQIDSGTSPPNFRMVLSPDANWLAVAPSSWQHATSRDGLRLWDLQSEHPLPRFSFRQAFTPLAFCSDGRRLVYPRMDGMVVVADYQTGMVLAEWKAHPERFYALALSPDNRLLATGGNDAVVRLWDMTSHEEVAEFSPGSIAADMAFAPDGKTLVTVTFDTDIKFWHVATKRQLFTVDQFRIAGYSARFSPNSEYLAIKGDDARGHQQVMLWRAPSWNEIAAAEAKAGGARRD
jgi:eukaryotic-like serine/threonine-protein kinase